MAHRERPRGLADAVRSAEAGDLPAHRRSLSEVHHRRERARLARTGGSSPAAGRQSQASQTPATREIFVHSVGNKRELIPDETCWLDYVSVPGREARRCHGLIRTIPALNNDTALSRPRMPEWMTRTLATGSRGPGGAGGDCGGV